LRGYSCWSIRLWGLDRSQAWWTSLWPSLMPWCIRWWLCTVQFQMLWYSVWERCLGRCPGCVGISDGGQVADALRDSCILMTGSVLCPKNQTKSAWVGLSPLEIASKGALGCFVYIRGDALGSCVAGSTDSRAQADLELDVGASPAWLVGQLDASVYGHGVWSCTTCTTSL